jgi:uncharacterized membrane protein (UPF0127 family)
MLLGMAAYGSRPTAALCLLLVALSFLALACSSKDEEPPVEEDDGRLRIVNSRGETVRLTIEVADTSEERSVGLSKRESLDAEAGMLFVFERRGLGFWMKDTTIPLSVAFIGACGDIVHVADMQPLSLQLVQARDNYSFGLEVNQGWFTKNNIAVGDKVVIPEQLVRPECVPTTVPTG